MALVAVASSGSAKASGVAGASFTGVAAGDGLLCFALYNSVAGSLTLSDSSGTKWALWTVVTFSANKIAVFVPTTAVGAGTHTLTASFTGGGSAWTIGVEDTQNAFRNFGAQKLVAPGGGNSLVPGINIGQSGDAIYQLAIDVTNVNNTFVPGPGDLSTQVFAASDTGVGSWTIATGNTNGGTDPGMSPNAGGDPSGADTYGVISVSIAQQGTIVSRATDQIVLVSEDVGPQQRTPYPLGMFFNRSSQTIPATPLAYMSIKTPPWEFYRDPFVSVYSVLEVYSQQTSTTSPSPFVVRYRGSRPPDQPEEDLRRFDHGVYFQIARYYTAQIVGYTFDVPDLNSDPWIEWVHPPASPESALFVYRRQIVPANPYQFPIMWGQPRPWYVDGEQDSVFRKPDVGVLIPFQRPVPPLILMPNLIGLDQATAISIILNLGLLYLGSVITDEIFWPLPPPTPWNPIGPFPPDQAGIVIGQWPLPGIPGGIDPISGNPFPPIGLVQPGLTQVTLYVSSGRDKIPDVGPSTSGNVPNTVIGSTKFP